MQVATFTVPHRNVQVSVIDKLFLLGAVGCVRGRERIVRELSEGVWEVKEEHPKSWNNTLLAPHTNSTTDLVLDEVRVPQSVHQLGLCGRVVWCGG